MRLIELFFFMAQNCSAIPGLAAYAASNILPLPQGIPPLALGKAPEELQAFVSLCICHNPALRPEARQLLKHPFFDCVRLTSGGMASAKSGW